MDGKEGLLDYFEFAGFFPVSMIATLRNHRFPEEKISKLAIGQEKGIVV